MYSQNLCSLLISSLERVFPPLNLWCSKLIKLLSSFSHPWNTLWISGINSPFFGGRFAHQRHCKEPVTYIWLLRNYFLNWRQPLCGSWGLALHLSSAQEEWRKEKVQEDCLTSWEPCRDTSLCCMPHVADSYGVFSPADGGSFAGTGVKSEKQRHKILRSSFLCSNTVAQWSALYSEVKGTFPMARTHNAFSVLCY